MSISIRPVPGAFAGEVSGLDITRPIDRADVAAIEAGMDAYAVLVFHDQDLTDEQQIAFTLNFGELEQYKSPGHIRKREDHRLGPGIADFSNLDRHGNIMSAEDRVWFFKLGDRLWHSDSSFRPAPAKYSLLSGRIIPSWGADTEFADMRAAYDALDARTEAGASTTAKFATCAGPRSPATPRPTNPARPLQEGLTAGVCHNRASCSRCPDSSRRSGICAPSTASISRSPRAPSPGSSARTAPARPRSSI